MNDRHPSGSTNPADSSQDFSYASHGAGYEASPYGTDAYAQQAPEAMYAPSYDGYPSGGYDNLADGYGAASFGGGDPLFGSMPGPGQDTGTYASGTFDAYGAHDAYPGPESYDAYAQGGTGYDTTGAWAQAGYAEPGYAGYPDVTGGIPAQPGPEQAADYGVPAGQSAWETGSFDTSGFDTGTFDASAFDTSGPEGYGNSGYGEAAYADSGYDTGTYGTVGYDTGAYATGAYDFGTGFETGAYDTTGADTSGFGTFDAGTPDANSFETGGFETGAFETGSFDTGAFDTGAYAGGFDGAASYGEAQWQTGDDFSSASWDTGQWDGGLPQDQGAWDTGLTEQPLANVPEQGTAEGPLDETSVFDPAAFETGTFETGSFETGAFETTAFEAVPGETAVPGADFDSLYAAHQDDVPGEAADEGVGSGASGVSPSVVVPSSRGRRRSPKPRRSALMTVAVPSVAVLGVTGVAAASVMGSGTDDDKTTEAADSASEGQPVKPSKANSKLDTQLAGLSADADDFADRASRTQERIDLKKRQAEERKRKAEEAARKEAMRPKFALPVKQHGLSAQFGSAGVNWMSVHTGIDFPVSYGTPVMAATDGTITTKWDISYGNMAVVTAPDGTETWYCHLSSTKIRSGEVKAGDTIGYSGNSGNSTGPHLHFEVRPGGGDAVDPLPWFRGKGLDPT